MTIEEIINRELEGVSNIPFSNPYNEVCNLIIKSHLIVFSGVGKAKEIAKTIVSQFNSISVKSILLDSTDAKHGDIGMLSDTDLLFLVSNSSKTNELIELIELANKITNNKIKIVTLTSNPNGPIAKKSDYILLTGNNREMIKDQTKPMGLVPTVSLTSMTILGNILTTLLIDKTNFTLDKYKYNHNSGYIAKLVKQGLLNK